MLMKRVNSKSEIIFFICFFIAVSAFVLAYSPIVQITFGHDTPAFLDGAWRIQNGQLPHIDFSSIVGYGFLYQQYIFLKLFNYDIIAIAVSTAVLITLLMIMYLSFYKSKTFITNSTFPLRLYIFLLLISLGLGQYCFGYVFTELTYACLYNRYGFECLLLLVLILIILNGKSTINKKDIALLIAISLLVNYLLFVKITFFLVAGGLVFLFTIFKYISFNHFKYLLLFFLIVFFTVLLLSSENFFSIIKDYKSIASVRTTELIKADYIIDKFYHLLDIIFLLSYGFLLFQLIRKKAGYKSIILLLFVGLMSVLLHFTNFGYRDIVFLTFIPCLFILPDFVPYRNLLSFKFLTFCCCYFIAKNLYSIILIPSSKSTTHTELQNKYVKHFYISSIIPKCKLEYSARQEDGVKLINKNIRPEEKVMSYTFENIFPLLTHTVPPKNNMLVWQDEMTYSKTHYPDPDYLFKDVNLLLIPNCDEWEASLVMKKIYAKTVREKFTKIDQSADWTLYRKSKP